VRRVVLAIAIAALLAAAVGSAVAGDADTVHYPDLRTLTPSDIKVQRDRATGAKLLRLSNTVANLGDGRLELRPENDPVTGTTQAY
jgi:FlaG/FlaF family flagellin (archaellin)